MAWRRAEERAHWKRLQRRRGKELGDLEHQSRREWAELYGHQGRQREQLAKDGRGVLGRWRWWREAGELRELAGALRGSAKMLGRWREDGRSPIPGFGGCWTRSRGRTGDLGNRTVQRDGLQVEL